VDEGWVFSQVLGEQRIHTEQLEYFDRADTYNVDAVQNQIRDKLEDNVELHIALHVDAAHPFGGACAAHSANVTEEK
jgi:hypothetical protein